MGKENWLCADSVSVDTSSVERSKLSASSSSRIASQFGTGCIIALILFFGCFLDRKIFLIIIFLEFRTYTLLMNNTFSKLNGRYSRLPRLEFSRLRLWLVGEVGSDETSESIEYALLFDFRN